MSREIVDRSAYDQISQNVCEGMSQGDAKMMRYCIRNSERLYRGVIDEKLVCVFGLMPLTLLSSKAYLWMWGTPQLRDHSFTLVRASQLMVEEMLRDYESLVGHCLVDNERAIRWLKWLGAEFGFPEAGRLPFEIRRK